MISVVSRLRGALGIESGEGRVFAWGAGTLWLIGWSAVSLTNVSETFFLKRVGVNHLPLVFLVNALLLVGTTYGMSRLAARLAPRRLLTGTFAVLGVVVVVLWLLVRVGAPGVFVLLVIASKQLDAIALIVFWIVLGGLLHGRQAKRLYAPIIAGGTLGKTFGSFASGSIGKGFGIPALLLVAATAFGLAGLLALRMRSAVPARVAQMAARRAPLSTPAALAKFRPLWRGSRLFRLLVMSALLGGTLAPMLYFQFSYIVDLATRGSNGEMRLLDLYAQLRGFINLSVLGMQLVGTSRVFRRVGVPLAATFSPLVYLLGFLGVSTRLDLPSGIGAIGGANLQDHAIQEPAQKILATLFPERVRAAATSLVEGPVQRTGGALGNILVLCGLAVANPAWVGFAALPIAGIWLAIAIALWRIYPTLLLEVVAASPKRAGSALSLSELVDPGTVRVLAGSLADPDLRRCRAACALVVEAPRAPAVAALARAIRHAPADNRPLLIETLHGLLERNPNARALAHEAAQQLEPLLADTALEAVERAHLVEAYARLVPSLRPGGHGADVLAQLLSDPTPAVRLAAQVHLHQAGLPQPAIGDLDTLLASAFASDDVAAHHIALEALRATLLATGSAAASDAEEAERWGARIKLVTDRLQDTKDRARAAEVLADVAAHDGSWVAASAELLLGYTHDPDWRVRAALLRFIGHARLEEQVGWVIQRLVADEPAEVAAAAEALNAFGPTATNHLLHWLNHGKRAIREAVFPLLRDVPVNAAMLRSLIDREIDGIQHLLLQRYALGAGPVSDLVLRRLGERIAAGLHTTLLLLATLLHEDRIAVLGHLLSRSPDGRGRAVLLEAVEALLPPPESARLMPLLENGSSPAMAMAAARSLGRALPSFDDAVRETLADNDQLTRTLLAATLDTQVLARVGGASGAANLAPHHDLEDHGAGSGAAREDSMLNRVEIMLHLRSIDLFARLTTRQLSELAGVVREESYPAGRIIVGEGEFGDCMYLMVDGEVRITREGRYVASLRPGEFFGEMAIFDGETRFATVTAATPLRLLRLQRHDLLQLMDEEPGIAIAVCQTLSRHVRDLIKKIEAWNVKGSSES